MAEIKSLTFEVKSIDEEGTIEGDLSVYGNIDAVSDIVEAGAFTEDLTVNGKKRPILWQHEPDKPIGWFEAEDTDRALRIKGRLCLAIQRGREAYELLKAGIIDGLSIGYITEDYQFAQKDGQNVRILKKLQLLEGSVVTFPCNRMARVTSVKSEDTNMDADRIDELEKRLKAIEDLLDEQKSKESEDEETIEDEVDDEPKSEDCEDEEKEGCESDEEEKSLLACLRNLTETISKKG